MVFSRKYKQIVSKFWLKLTFESASTHHLKCNWLCKKNVTIRYFFVKIINEKMDDVILTMKQNWTEFGDPLTPLYLLHLKCKGKDMMVMEHSLRDVSFRKQFHYNGVYPGRHAKNI